MTIHLYSQASAFDSLTVVHTSTIFFDFGQHELQSNSDTTLRTLVAKTTELALFQIHIEAHTDSIGSLENNQILSQKRAESVKNWLLQNGLSQQDAIRTTPYGESNPNADNRTEESRQLNRRATIKLYKKTPMTLLEGQITDQEGKGIEAMVVLHSKKHRDTLQTLPNGKFQKLVPKDIVLGVDVFAKGYFFETQMLKTKLGKITPVEVKLPEVKKGEIVPIKNLYFVGNQAVLLPISEPQLPKVLRFMQVNSDTKIEIAGHINLPNTPKVTKDTWHYDLSLRRAQLVYDYLLENNIDSTRVQYQGYGNWEMKFPNATHEKQMSLNRRVEIRILE